MYATTHCTCNELVYMYATTLWIVSYWFILGGWRSTTRAN